MDVNDGVHFTAVCLNERAKSAHVFVRSNEEKQSRIQ